MKRHYTVILATLLVGVLAGFVLNTQQAPTRWEYGLLERETHLVQTTRRTLFTRWITQSENVMEISDSVFHASLDCPVGSLVPEMYNCLGTLGWELAGISTRFTQRTASNDEGEYSRTTAIFKRLVQ